MAAIRTAGATIYIETDLLTAEVHAEGYVSGVAAGTLLDKTTGARDLGFGLDIVDFLLEPRADEPDAEHPYHVGDAFHGDLVKRYVELPQICTGARAVGFETFEGPDWVAVKQWFTYQQATYGRTPGSLWEQTLVFRDGLRYFMSADRVTSANTVDELTLRIDMPGHLKHSAGSEFRQIYLSYDGAIQSSEFIEDFAPDSRHLYQRDAASIPERMIRAYQVALAGCEGPWLAGMTLDPAIVSEAWCHQRGYVCFIQEIGCLPVDAGESFGAAYIVGWFDDIDGMQTTYDQYKGASDIHIGDEPEFI